VETDSQEPNEASQATRLLLVDDEPDLVSTLAEILQDQGYAVVSTLEGEDAVDVAELYHPNIVISDFRLPGIDGVTTIRRVRQESPRMRAILVSGHISAATRERAEEEHVDCIFQKPLSIPELLRALRCALR
jgi:DNA-binding response OmpR family regulator